MKSFLFLSYLLINLLFFDLNAGVFGGLENISISERLLTKPNIVVLVIDDAGYADFGFQGSSLMETPNLDQLKSEGTYFSQAYVTNSVCAPSRAGILTGRYQNRFGFEYNIVTYQPAPERTNKDVGLDPEEKTLADHLKPLGYSTAMIGKWHLGEEEQHHPNNRGFDYFYGLLGGSRPYFSTTDLPSNKKLMRNDQIDDLADGYMTDVLTDDAISWMGQQIDAEKPFMTYLSYTAVHGPYESKPDDLARYENCSDCNNKRKNLAAMTYNFDQNLGKLVDSLKQKGVYDNTIIFVINDNGGNNPGAITNNGQLRGGKSSQYEGGLRVPFIVKWKDYIPANLTYDKQVISTDIAATAIKAAGGNLPEIKPLDGVDLVPAVNNDEIAHDYLFWRKKWNWSIAMKDKKKLIIDYNDPLIESDNDTVLYDLNVDISESNNLFTNSDETIASNLISELTSWESTLKLPDWIGKFQYDKLCEDVSNNFTNCAFVQEAYAESVFSFEIEAEKGTLAGPTAEIITSCNTASEGAFVKLNIDAQNSVSFDNIDVPKAGKYRLILDYYTVNSGFLQVFVNGISSTIEVSAANWCFEGPSAERDFAVELNSGTNTIAFSPIEGNSSPLIDKLIVKDFFLSKINIATQQVRMLPSKSVELEFVTNESVVSDQTFDITIEGLTTDQYTISSSQVIIPAGAKRGTVTFSSKAMFGLGSFKLTNPSLGIEFGEQTVGSISILDTPTTFYVSSTVGDDANDGMSIEQPLKSVTAITKTLLIPGDAVLFNRGDVFNGQLAINSSGRAEQPLIFSSYGDETLDKPVIDGSMDAEGSFISAILIEGQQYLEISNLKLINDRNNSGSRAGVPDEVAYGLYLVNEVPNTTLEYFRFDNLDIENIYPVANASEIDFNAIQIGGIYITNPRNNSDTGVRGIKDIVIENSLISRVGKLAIWIRHRGGQKGANGEYLVGDAVTNKIQDVVIRNNHTFETGGSGVVLSGVHNALVESNVFEYPGSDVDPRMAARGSGAWIFSSNNIVLQHNKSLHARGSGDSYGYHIDYGNNYVLFQYNYSEDAEGGFVEILGDNLYSTYRYNISVNDGFRASAKTLWVSTFAGQNRDIASDQNYIYNNTVFVGGENTTDILIRGINTFVYNNIFYVADQAQIGESALEIPLEGGKLTVDNNVYFGNINSDFTDFDQKAIFDDPRYANPGALDPNGYLLKKGSPALNASINFPEPLFPEEEKGIFANVTAKAIKDYFGNPVDISMSPHLGAFNGSPLELAKVKVNLSLNLMELKAGEKAVISAEVSTEVLDEQKVRIGVVDIDEVLFTLSSAEITIEKDQKTGSVEITANADNQNLEDVSGSIFITSLTDGLEDGEVTTLDIVIIKIDAIPLGLEDETKFLIVYPNPVFDAFKFEIENVFIEYIELIDLEGRLVFKTGKTDDSIDISNFSNGTYLAKATARNGQVYKVKVLKK